MNISEIYDKIGTVLRVIRAKRGSGAAATFISSEVYALYVHRYPGDVQIMEVKIKGKQHFYFSELMEGKNEVD